MVVRVVLVDALGAEEEEDEEEEEEEEEEEGKQWPPLRWLRCMCRPPCGEGQTRGAAMVTIVRSLWVEEGATRVELDATYALVHSINDYPIHLHSIHVS